MSTTKIAMSHREEPRDRRLLQHTTITHVSKAQFRPALNSDLWYKKKATIHMGRQRHSVEWTFLYIWRWRDQPWTSDLLNKSPIEAQRTDDYRTTSPQRSLSGPGSLSDAPAGGGGGRKRLQQFTFEAKTKATLVIFSFKNSKQSPTV